MTAWAPVWLLAACHSELARGELELEGPARVEVEQLGLVHGPDIVVEGAEGAQPTLSVTPAEVAVIQAGEVHAVGAGQAVVRATWEDQQVSWTLVVKPALPLVWVAPPAQVDVGGSVQLKLRAGTQELNVEHPLVWRSSDPQLALVSSTGEVAGRAPGLVYITAQEGSSRALLELRVVAPLPVAGDLEPQPR